MAGNAIQRRWIHDDVVQLLHSTNATVNDVEESLSIVLLNLESANGLSYVWMFELVGMAIEAYRLIISISQLLLFPELTRISLDN